MLRPDVISDTSCLPSKQASTDKHQIQRYRDALAYSVYLPHSQTFFQNSLHLSEEKRIFAEELRREVVQVIVL